MRSRLLGLIGLLLGTTVALLWAAPGASAHASLVASDPTEGQRLDALPATVSFEFSEDMAEPAYVVVTGPDGSSVASGDPQVQGAIVSQALDGSDAAGTYTMAYRAVSADGHPVTGQISFTVGDGSADASASGGSSATAAPTASSSAPVASAAPPAGETSVADDDPEGFWERRGLQVGGAGLLVLAAGGAWLLSRRAE